MQKANVSRGDDAEKVRDTVRWSFKVPFVNVKSEMDALPMEK